MDKKRKDTFLVRKLNLMPLRRKLLIMQVFCVILPLLVTDSVVISILVGADQRANYQEMNNIADSVKYTITDSVESAMSLMQNVYSNQYINNFIERDFKDPLDYYNRYTQFFDDSLYTVCINNNMHSLTIYADNPGVVNGGYFKRVDLVEESKWYRDLMESNRDIMVRSDFEQLTWQKQRCIYLVRKMDHNKKKNSKAVMRLDINYSKFQEMIMNAHYSTDVFVCEGSKILFSNIKKGGTYADFEVMRENAKMKAGVRKTINLYGSIWEVFVMPPEITYMDTIVKNLPLLAVLIFMNIFLPFALMSLINISFTQRLKELDEVFTNVGEGEIYPLPDVRGNDEISELMESYNEMAHRVNELIETEYKNRLKRQEINIARQKAELLALHSQINPHFLFNALESIRMHSIIKKEYETADMVQKLALMQRQNVEWGNDSVKIREEIHFIEAYLELQKYRFGDRLSYEIRMDDNCGDFRIPKLTLVTFVENACIHGIENKTTTGWVFLRVYMDAKNLILEVEDTGNGMTDEKCAEFVEGMNNVNIEMLQGNGRIGIYNAALRLKMISEDTVRFEMESEMGVGTLVTISIPLESAEKMKLR